MSRHSQVSYTCKQREEEEGFGELGALNACPFSTCFLSTSE